MLNKTFALILTTLFLASILTLSGCNTVEGAGKDIEKGGKAIKDEANENK
jgi:entericidin B